jgi:hypothetical protein
LIAGFIDHLQLVTTDTCDTIANLQVQQITISLTGKLLQALSSTMVLGSESQGTHEVILVFDASRRLQSPALWHKLCESVIVFPNRCLLAVPNSGNYSALLLTWLSAGCRLTASPQLATHQLRLIMTLLVTSLYMSARTE